MAKPLEDSWVDLEARFLARLFEATYPCVGAKAALGARSIALHAYVRPDGDAARALVQDLIRFEEGRGRSIDPIFASFVAVFEAWEPAGEAEFQRELFAWLQLVHEEDRACGHPWDPTASPDPADPHFGFSVASRAYFLVGMHRRSSRLARQFDRPAVVFNAHAQFATLRKAGTFEKLKLEIRARDVRLQGSHNPEMVGTKEVSEARQYSGRRNERAWVCPLIILK